MQCGTDRSCVYLFLSDCRTRFTHANRHCPDHPTQALVRDNTNMPPPSLDAYATSPEATGWLQRCRYFLSFHLSALPLNISTLCVYFLNMIAAKVGFCFLACIASTASGYCYKSHT